MNKPKIVSREEWLQQRKVLLAKEKEFTRLRDQLTRERQALPWVAVEKDYLFEGPAGKESLADLFDGRTQLLVYHFMFGPDWDEGCPSCSFWADNFNGAIVHLNHRDISMIAVSRAPLKKLEDYKQRMGWGFKWVSSLNSDFNWDYQVSFTPEQLAQGAVIYNYRMTSFPGSEAPGVSVFYKDNEGKVYHTYSCFARGLDILNGAYQHMDLVPRGRDENGFPYPMAWLRRHDSYED